MTTHIKKILTLGLIAYLCLAGWQLLSHPEIYIQVIALSLVLIILTAITWMNDEERLNKIEMGILWVCVGMFGLYAVLVAGRIV